jgi:hypothetical protein
VPVGGERPVFADIGVEELDRDDRVLKGAPRVVLLRSHVAAKQQRADGDQLSE